MVCSCWPAFGLALPPVYNSDLWMGPYIGPPDKARSIAAQLVSAIEARFSVQPERVSKQRYTTARSEYDDQLRHRGSADPSGDRQTRTVGPVFFQEGLNLL